MGGLSCDNPRNGMTRRTAADFETRASLMVVQRSSEVDMMIVRLCVALCGTRKLGSPCGQGLQAVCCC
jgi:hypothetical protein